MSTRSDPAQGAKAITPHDTNSQKVSKGIYVGGGGNIKLKSYDGNTVTFIAVVAGTILPVAATIVFDTDTTATYLIALN